MAYGVVMSVLVLVAVMLWMRDRLRIVEVRGQSMQPTYRDGDRLLVRRGRAQTGRVVVFRRPAGLGADVDWLVKRAVATGGQPVPPPLRAVVTEMLVPDGRLLVLGDNPRSVDSRHFGYIAESDVLGTPIGRLSTGEETSRRALR